MCHPQATLLFSSRTQVSSWTWGQRSLTDVFSFERQHSFLKSVAPHLAPDGTRVAHQTYRRVNRSSAARSLSSEGLFLIGAGFSPRRQDVPSRGARTSFLQESPLQLAPPFSSVRNASPVLVVVFDSTDVFPVFLKLVKADEPTFRLAAH